MKATIRKDIQEQKLKVPTENGNYIFGYKIYPAKWIEDSLYIFDDYQWVKVESIDFDLIDDKLINQ